MAEYFVRARAFVCVCVSSLYIDTNSSTKIPSVCFGKNQVSYYTVVSRDLCVCVCIYVCLSVHMFVYLYVHTSVCGGELCVFTLFVCCNL